MPGLKGCLFEYISNSVTAITNADLSLGISNKNPALDHGNEGIVMLGFHLLRRLSIFVMSFLSILIYAEIGQAISYTDIGQGQPLILIHAFPTDKQLWQEQQDGLKSQFRVIALDLQGFGESPSSNGQAILMEQYANDIKQLIDHLQLQKVILGGESMGGYVALVFCQKYPDYVSGLILSGTQSIADSNEVKERRERVAQDLLANGTANFITDFVSKLVSPNASSQIQEFLLNIMRRQNASGMASALRGMAVRQDTSEFLAQSNLPILIISGSEDKIISSEQSIAMSRLAKNSTLVILENTGHLSSLEKPVEWNQAVISKFGQSDCCLSR